MAVWKMKKQIVKGKQAQLFLQQLSLGRTNAFKVCKWSGEKIVQGYFCFLKE
jgi:hypothetical protein